MDGWIARQTDGRIILVDYKTSFHHGNVIQKLLMGNKHSAVIDGWTGARGWMNGCLKYSVRGCRHDKRVLNGG